MTLRLIVGLDPGSIRGRATPAPIAATVPDDGRVLVLGGIAERGSGGRVRAVRSASAELYQPD